jgi:hypothetical protein
LRIICRARRLTTIENGIVAKTRRLLATTPGRFRLILVELDEIVRCCFVALILNVEDLYYSDFSKVKFSFLNQRSLPKHHQKLSQKGAFMTQKMSIASQD